MVDPGELLEPLAQGSLADAYPINDQASDTFQVGGVERSLPDALQLEQLVTYIEATYDTDAEQYLALLPDRITHAAMLMLGSGIDQTMPGVAFPGDVQVEDCELGQIFVPSGVARADTSAGTSAGTPHADTSAGSAWAISLWDGPHSARDVAWRPEVAGAAELSGVRILDLDDPARLADGIAFARAAGATKVAVWARSSAASHIDAAHYRADAFVLTFPTTLPATLLESGGAPVLLQVATRDEIAPILLEDLRSTSENTALTVREYHSTHFIATPAESRRRVRDVAEFLASL